MAHDVRSPHIFVDGPGNTASGDQVMDNFDSLWVARDALAQPGRIVSGAPAHYTAGQEVTNSTSYVALTTPDTVSGLVVPTEGIIVVQFTALWKVTGGTGFAAIFIGANQLKAATNAGGAAAIQDTQTTNGFVSTIQSTGQGLSNNSGTVASDSTNVTTGQAINAGATTSAAECKIFGLPAATYSISVLFKNSVGGANQTQVKERHLWCRVEGY